MVLADFLALSKLGSSIAMSNEIIDMTTSNSISVKPRVAGGACGHLVRGIEIIPREELCMSKQWTSQL